MNLQDWVIKNIIIFLKTNKFLRLKNKFLRVLDIIYIICYNKVSNKGGIYYVCNILSNKRTRPVHI